MVILHFVVTKYYSLPCLDKYKISVNSVTQIWSLIFKIRLSLKIPQTHYIYNHDYDYTWCQYYNVKPIKVIKQKNINKHFEDCIMRFELNPADICFHVVYICICTYLIFIRKETNKKK